MSTDVKRTHKDVVTRFYESYQAFRLAWRMRRELWLILKAGADHQGFTPDERRNLVYLSKRAAAGDQALERIASDLEEYEKRQGIL